MSRLANLEGARWAALIASESFKSLDIGWQSGLLDGIGLWRAWPPGNGAIDALPASGYIDPEDRSGAVGRWGAWPARPFINFGRN